MTVSRIACASDVVERSDLGRAGLCRRNSFGMTVPPRVGCRGVSVGWPASYQALRPIPSFFHGSLASQGNLVPARVSGCDWASTLSGVGLVAALVVLECPDMVWPVEINGARRKGVPAMT